MLLGVPKEIKQSEFRVGLTPSAVGEYVAQRATAGEGIELLDVATGAGNVSIPAARAGAKVTGLDLTPKLLDAQRARAAEACEERTSTSTGVRIPLGAPPAVTRA